MRRIMILLMFALIFVMISSEVFAFGVSPGRKQFDYQPQLDGQIKIINSHKQSVDLILVARGELSEYVIFGEHSVKLSPETHEVNIPYTVRVPQEKLKQGPNQIDVFVMPLSLFAAESTVSAQAGIITSIIINVPYDGIYAIGRLDFNANSKEIIVPVTNMGTERIRNVKVSATVIGPTSEIILSKAATEDTLGIKETKEFIIPITEVESGNYMLRATIEYDDKIIVLERQVSIGTQRAVIQSINLQDFRYGQINRIDVGIKSEWNQVINDAYAMIEIIGPSGQLVERLRTPGETLQPFRTETLRGYWDTAGILPGDHQIIATVVAEGGNDTKTVLVTITPTGIVMQDPTARATGEGMGLIGFALAFLVIANIVLFMIIFSRKKNKKVKK